MNEKRGLKYVVVVVFQTILSFLVSRKNISLIVFTIEYRLKVNGKFLILRRSLKTKSVNLIACHME